MRIHLTLFFLTALLLVCGVFLSASMGIPASWTLKPLETSADINADPHHFETILTGANPNLKSEEVKFIIAAIFEQSEKHGIEPDLILAIILVESSAFPQAISAKGAIGLMQVMPYMAEGIGFKGDLFAIDNNIMVGAFILTDNIRRWGYREGIQRYFWGSLLTPSGIYISKVEKTLMEIKQKS